MEESKDTKKSYSPPVLTVYGTVTDLTSFLLVGASDGVINSTLF